VLTKTKSVRRQWRSLGLKIQPRKHISGFTFDCGFVHFGAGYHLYRIDLATRSVDRIYTTNDTLKPFIQ
jgi:hypothetical protein